MNKITFAENKEGRFVEQRHLWYLLLILISLICGAGLIFVKPIIIIGVIGVLMLGALIFYYPYLGAIAYITFEYARLSSMFPGLQVLQIGKLIVVPTIAIMFIRYISNKYIKISYDKLYTFFIAWLIIAIISIFSAIDQKLALEASIDLAKWFAIVFMIANLVNSKPKWQIFMWLFLLLNFKMSQFQLRHFIVGYSSAENLRWFIQEGIGVGTGGYFDNANDFGIAMVIVAPLALYLFKSVKPLILKLIAGSFTGIFIVSILISGSRGAALGLFAALIAFWVKSKNKAASLILVLILIAGFWVIAPGAWKDRFISAKDYSEDATASARLRLWQGGIDMFLDHPLTGVGIYNFPMSWIRDYRPAGVGGATVVHNIFIEAASELGIGGLVVLIAVLIMLFRRNRELRRIYWQHNINEPWYINFSHALDCSLIGFIVHGCFLTVLYYPHLYIISALLLSLYYIVKRRAESQEIEAEIIKT